MTPAVAASEAGPGWKRLTKHIIAGTAGHIDHGKTALVRALTGIDADRLQEEKRRGITIDIGFAHLRLGPELQLGFVDVPGHERFVKNMLAGVGGIDLLLLVVAADESVMPQTREHFDICRLLGIRHGLVALTKADLVDADIAELVKLEVEEFLSGSFLAGAPLIPVSSKTGEGLEELREALATVARAVEAKSSRRHFRLPIDRVFVMKGFGTVVTGTTVSGSLEVESEVEVCPLGRRVRVRGLEVHNQAAQQAEAGQRTAVNLAGIGTELLERGMALTAPGKFRPARQADCVLDLLPSAKPLKHGAPVHFHSGTAEVVGRVYFLDRRTALKPSERSYAQIRLEKPLLLLPEDRFILRQFSPLITIGGGRVLDNRAARHRASDDWQRRLKALESGVAERVLEVLIEGADHGVGQQEIVARTAWLEEQLDEAAQALERGGIARRVHERPLWLVHQQAFQAAADRVTTFLEHFHEQNPLLPGASKEALRSALFPEAPPFFADQVLAHLTAAKEVAIEAETVRLAAHRIVFQKDEEDARQHIIKAFQEAGLRVPGLRELLEKLPVDNLRARKILQGLLREQTLVRVSEDLVFHRESVEQLKQLLAERKVQSDRLSVLQFKDLTGISRKYAIPLLEYLDREKITRRLGDQRVIL